METPIIPTLAQNPPVKKLLKSTTPDRTILLGYLLLSISTVLYGLEEHVIGNRSSDDFTIFFIHYFIALGYVIALILNKSYGIRKSWQKENIHKTVVLLNLFLVSAYALNRPIPVFKDSVTWLCVYLILTSIVTLSYQYFDILPKAVNCIQHLLLGSAFVLYLYLTIYVANFYAIATIGILFFGIGAHIFVPLLLLGRIRQTIDNFPVKTPLELCVGYIRRFDNACIYRCLYN